MKGLSRGGSILKERWVGRDEMASLAAAAG